MLRDKIAEIQQLEDGTWLDTDTGEITDQKPKDQQDVQFVEEKKFAKDDYWDSKYYNKYGKVCPFNIIFIDMLNDISAMSPQQATDTVINTIEQLNRAYPNDKSYDYVSREYINKLKMNLSKKRDINQILQYLTNIYFKCTGKKRNILRKQAENELLSILKEDIQGEIDAIELYTEHINKVHNPEIKARLIEIRTDEEEHLKELKDLVHKWFH